MSHMDDNLQRLKTLLATSTISADDQNELLSFFAATEKDDLVAAVDLFSAEPAWIEKVSQNLKAKQKAISSRDRNLWNEIVQGEAKELQALED